MPHSPEANHIEAIERDVLKRLSQTKEEILRRLAPFAENVPDRNASFYPERINAYVDEVERARADFAPKLEAIAQKISSLGGEGWQDDDRMVQFWLAFTHVVQTLRHNTAKGPAAVYVSADNQLISYSAANFFLAEMHPSIKLRTKLQQIDSRSDHNICAEPAAAANAIGHEEIGTSSVLLEGKKWSKQHVVHDPEHPMANSKYIPLTRSPERRAAFIKRVKKLGRSSGKFDDSILVTTADPCGSCTRVLIEMGVAEVITDAQRFCIPMKDKRLAEMAKSAQRLDENGVKHRHVHYHLNI